MGQAKVNITMSLDGYVAGPGQSEEHPLGIGGMRLHDWIFGLRSWRETHGLEGGESGPDDALAAEILDGVGAVVMGRNMFGGGPGPWREPAWEGWWGADPPFHVPVFVLTRHPREPLAMEGGTTFTFVTDGLAAALERARAAAGDRDVSIAGGASTVNQALAAGVVDELQLHVAPLLLGGGERLFEGLAEPPALELTRTVASPAVTHLRYRVVR